jgi:flagellar basal-body rod modification protein FlgD
MLDQSSFLKLMTTQLKTQDPFNPVDNTQMVAQMAQFSSVAGISEMNASLKSISADIAASRVGDAASWIGRAALVKSDVAAQLSNGGYAGEVDLPQDASDVSISLTDANGQIVHREDLGEQAQGTLKFAWEGRDGVTGPLRVIVTGRGSDGAFVPSTSTWTEIGGVQSPASGSTKLVTALGLISPEEALRLS